MRLPRILNHCHPVPGFVYGQASFVEDRQTILIPVRPRKRSAAICSGCHQPAPGYDQSPTPRRFEFIGFWGYLVFLVYCMRRVNCKQCGVLVEEVPWGMGKHTSTKVHMHFLGHWARKLSWKETAEEFRTSWDKVHDAVEYLVTWGLGHRVLGVIRAIGVDEIQRGKGHKYLTLVYQIDLGCTRLLWMGKERTVKTFKEFFTMIGPEVSAKIEFVCSDMWKPYLGVIREKCSQALNILDRFHIVAKVNKALDDIRSAEARRMKGGRIRTGPDQVSVVPSQAASQPHRQPKGKTERSGALQPPERSRLSTQGRLPATLELRVDCLGGQVPRPMVSSSDALADRADEESYPDSTRPPRTHPQLFPRPERVLQRRNRGSEQQSQSHYEKILWVPNLSRHRTGTLPFTWKTP
jgi:transposase